MVELNSRRIIRRLCAEGWDLVRIDGSHHVFRKGARTVVVVHPKRDMAIGTAHQIARAAGWKDRT